MFRCVSTILYCVSFPPSCSLSMSLVRRCVCLCNELQCAAKVVNLRLYCCIHRNEKRKRVKKKKKSGKISTDLICFAKRIHSVSCSSTLLADLMRLSTQCWTLTHTHSLAHSWLAKGAIWILFFFFLSLYRSFVHYFYKPKPFWKISAHFFSSSMRFHWEMKTLRSST